MEVVAKLKIIQKKEINNEINLIIFTFEHIYYLLFFILYIVSIENGTKEEGEKYAQENGSFIFEEVSAKKGDGFSSLFYNKLFKEIVKKCRL